MHKYLPSSIVMHLGRALSSAFGRLTAVHLTMRLAAQITRSAGHWVATLVAR